LRPWQMLPAVARQRDFVGVRSDMDRMRLPRRFSSFTYLRREIVRGAYDLRLLPRQLLLLASGKGWIVEVGHSGRLHLTAQPAAMPAE